MKWLVREIDLSRHSATPQAIVTALIHVHNTDDRDGTLTGFTAVYDRDGDHLGPSFEAEQVAFSITAGRVG